MKSCFSCALCYINYRAVANSWVGWVLAQPIIVPEETTPNKLTFATVILFAKGPIFIPFGICKAFLKRNEEDVRYTIIETVLGKIINKRLVTS